MSEYDSQVGLNAPTVSAETFGAGTGEALNRLGRVVQSGASQFAEYQEKQNMLWADAEMSKLHMQFTKKLIDQEQQEGGPSAGLYSQLSSEMEASYKELLKRSPHGNARDYITQRFMNMGESFGERAMRMEAAGNAMRNRQNGETVINGMSSWEEMYNYVKTMESDKLVNPGDMDSTLIDKSRQMNGDDETASLIEQGKIGSSIPEADRPGMVEGLRNNAKVAAMASSADANMKLRSLASKAANGDTVDLTARDAFIAAHTTAVRGDARARQAAAAGAKFDEAIAQGRATYSIKQLFIGRPISEWEGIANTFAERYGPESDQGKLVGNVLKDIGTQAQKDPAAFVLNNKILRDDYTAAFQTGEPEKIQSAIGKVIAAQEQAGVSQHALTAKQATAMSLQIRSILQSGQVKLPDGTVRSYNADDAVRAIQSYEKTFGPYTSNVMRDLATLPDEKTAIPMVAQYIAALPTDSPQAVDMVKSVMAPQDARGKEVAPLDAAKAKDIDAAITENQTWKDFASSISGVTNQIPADEIQMIRQYAHYLRYSGKAADDKEAVDKAIGDTIGSVFKFQDGLVIPAYRENGTPISDDDVLKITDTLAQVRSEIADHFDASQILELRATDADGKVDRKVLKGWVANNTGWVTTQDKRGVKLVRGHWSYSGWFGRGQKFQPSGGELLVDGKPVIMSYDTIEKNLVNYEVAGFIGHENPLDTPYPKEKILKMIGNENR